MLFSIGELGSVAILPAIGIAILGTLAGIAYIAFAEFFLVIIQIEKNTRNENNN